METVAADYNVGGHFYCAEVALAIGLRLLEARLESGYYRQVTAFAHDAATLRDTAVQFNGAAAPVAPARSSTSGK